LPAAAASFTVNDAMFTMACTSMSHVTGTHTVAGMLRAPWLGFELRHTDAASGV
jgi:hypothetical protein